ncbi:MAG: hypothetical protein CL677_09930 [Bdellovibrionaceae bacterium]|nr:hypothetical protein [Pseudobdellovibrionaceae bacterium]|tara:strand:- start:177505 stop:178437 length:933 start_codon:yes stop_codon:yes gene_type:complete
MFNLSKPKKPFHKLFLNYPDVTEGDVFVTELACIDGDPLAPHLEAVNAVKILSKKSSLPLHLCFSGGLHSLVMLEAFLKAEVSFDISVLEFSGGFNDGEVAFAKEVLESLGLSYKVIDLPIVDFFLSGKFYDYSLNYGCLGPETTVVLWMFDQIHGVPILGSAPMLPGVFNGQKYWRGVPDENLSCLWRYFEKTGREGVPFFQLATPGLAASFSHQMLSNSEYSLGHLPDTWGRSELMQLYSESGFSMHTQVGKKSYAFDRLRHHFDFLFDGKNGYSFTRLFRVPLERLQRKHEMVHLRTHDSLDRMLGL